MAEAGASVQASTPRAPRRARSAWLVALPGLCVGGCGGIAVIGFGAVVGGGNARMRRRKRANRAILAQKIRAARARSSPASRRSDLVLFALGSCCPEASKSGQKPLF